MSDMEFGIFAQLLGVGGAITLIGWVIKRVFTHTIPRLAQDFKDSLKELQDMFQKSLEQQREDFRDELKRQREDFKDITREEREQWGRKIDRVAEGIERLLAKD